MIRERLFKAQEGGVTEDIHTRDPAASCNDAIQNSVV